MATPLSLVIILTVAACTTTVHGSCASQKNSEQSCSTEGCSKLTVDCKEFTRMPYPTATGQTSLLPGATPAYGASTFAKWDELYPPAAFPAAFPLVKNLSPYAFDTATYVSIEPTELHFPVKYRAAHNGKEMTTRGTMEFVTTFELDETVAVEQSAGAAVTMPETKLLTLHDF